MSINCRRHRALAVALSQIHILSQSHTARFKSRPVRDSACATACAQHFDAIALGALSAPNVRAERIDHDFELEFMHCKC